jgi:hypothetical protein
MHAGSQCMLAAAVEVLLRGGLLLLPLLLCGSGLDTCGKCHSSLQFGLSVPDFFKAAGSTCGLSSTEPVQNASEEAALAVMLHCCAVCCCAALCGCATAVKQSESVLSSLLLQAKLQPVGTLEVPPFTMWFPWAWILWDCSSGAVTKAAAAAETVACASGTRYPNPHQQMRCV